MWFYLLAAGLLLHTYFWGLGLAWLTLPRVWRRWWWIFAPGYGLALQSTVVWVGAHLPLAGTQAYAWVAEIIPAALMLLAWSRGAAWRGGMRGLAGVAGATMLVVLAGWFLLAPMAATASKPTTLSLGSCDAADYAAGARVMREFARDDRTGFLGLPEVTRVRSTEYFYDFWLRLNHFTPSAFIAYGGVILDVPAHELTGLTGVVFHLMNVPLLLFLARLALGLKGKALLLLTGLMAFSPLQTYAIDQCALGQLLATQAVLLLTVVVYGAVRMRRPWSLAAPATVAFCILAGGYNLFLPVCLAPAGGWLLAQAAVGKRWRLSLRVVLMLAGTLGVSALVFWTRFAGLIERFSLFEEYNFGWPIPRLTPEGWVGLVSDAGLHPWPAGLRILLLGVVATGWLLGVLLLWWRQRARALAALMFVVPVAMGWAILDRETLTRANASYDAYKIASVFQGVLLVGLGGWFVAMQDRRRWLRLAGACAGVGMLLAVLVAGARFYRAMRQAPLRVDRSLLELGRLEADARIGSLNMRVEDFWARMWANALLLRKPQYFVTHSYEGRLDTPLRGEWDLSDSLVKVMPPSPADFIVCNERFHLVRVVKEGRLLVQPAEGWYEPEREDRRIWRWTSGEARLVVRNPTEAPVRFRLTVQARALDVQPVQIVLNGREQAQRTVGLTMGSHDFGEMQVPPGESVLLLRGTAPARPPENGESRSLSLAVEGVVLQVLGDGNL